MTEFFPTYEVGSLLKPNWRVKGLRGSLLTEKDLEEVETWGRKLGLEYSELIEVLKGDRGDRRQQILEWTTRYALKMLEKAGLDYVYDGEQWRSEMYEHVISHLDGFEFQGWIKSFDYRYYRKAAVIAKVQYRTPYYLNEFLCVKKHAKQNIKVPFTGPYTLMDWTFNEYYERMLARRISNFNERKLRARKDLLFTLVEDALRPEIDELVKAGAKWIQIDEPAVTTHPFSEEMEMFVEAYNKLVKGFNCTFSLHNCYSNYKLLAEYAPSLKGCSQLSLEFANRDFRKVGGMRTGYDELRLFEEHGFKGAYAPGIIDVHSDFIASPELVRDRILYVADIVGAEKIYVSPDCGLRTRSWEVAYKKLKNMVEGAGLARAALE